MTNPDNRKEKQLLAIAGALGGLKADTEGPFFDYLLLKKRESQLIRHMDLFSGVLCEHFPSGKGEALMQPPDHAISDRTLPPFVQEFLLKELTESPHFSVGIIAQRADHATRSIHVAVVDRVGKYKRGIAVATVNGGKVGVYVCDAERKFSSQAVRDAQKFVTSNINRGTPLQNRQHHLEVSKQILFFVGHQIVQ